MTKTLLQSKKAKAEDDAKPEPSKLNVPTFRRDDVIRIAPIYCLNDWVILIPFMIDTSMELPANSEYKNVGIVVGKSDSIIAANGTRISSSLEYGQVVLFQIKSVIGDMFINKDPYVGKKMIILSERNIICQLVGVPFEILDVKIGQEDFNEFRPV